MPTPSAIAWKRWNLGSAHELRAARPRQGISLAATDSGMSERLRRSGGQGSARRNSIGHEPSVIRRTRLGTHTGQRGGRLAARETFLKNKPSRMRLKKKVPCP